MIIKLADGKGKGAVENFARKEWQRFNLENGWDWKVERHSFGAYDGKEVVGFASCKLVGGAAYLSQLIVSKNARGKGVGDALLRRFETLADARNCHTAYLETSEKHKGALKFYRARGYKTAASIKDNKFHLTWYILSKPIS